MHAGSLMIIFSAQLDALSMLRFNMTLELYLKFQAFQNFIERYDGGTVVASP